MKDMPILIVVAGPNGAGKSTFIAQQKIINPHFVVNPDVIAAELNSQHLDDIATQIKAGRIALIRRKKTSC